ncbi:hypothetical protein [Jannaschia donghaensis]|uniref:Pantothenate kinase n=1 Tax=Jannaschia donghaensis TaxID=420998 RepID=A0A0M6YLF6_9RHOB|nr:hypothetical protein [Jannaschia donghaensis]CTQ51191.1 Pantothenate kinase [Jannaschia donghaensis]
MAEAIDITALAAHLSALPPGRRLVAVAGPPAAGKSTVTENLAARITTRGRRAQVVPMDGFHLSNSDLDDLGLRTRKGAPETFDVPGLLALMTALRSGSPVAFPTFDRAVDATVPDGGIFDADIAIVEGNYLLLDEDPWRGLLPLWDTTVMLDVPEDVLRDRLVARWVAHGMTTQAGLARAEANDLPNARRVQTGSVAADHVLRTA